jgi:crotonobetainyl-CoA:carnitine CoA-transferase CaiB-like acyl-CoA transferase
MQPLQGIRVLDFSTLLPGPMCTLLLAEAGADVIKIERPGSGDDMRGYEPKLGPDSVNFALLNRGKKSVTADLKNQEDLAAIRAMIAQADVIVEQFRPGVMARLGLGFEDVCKINPKIIYCSITGYGQYGPLAKVAAHDLNYQAEAGMLSLTCDLQGHPSIPPTLTADLAGGAYHAVMNILLALRQRDLDGKPRHLDVAMADNLFSLMYWGLGSGLAANAWPNQGGELVTGGSARYQIYRTSDGKYLAAAPIEDKFWQSFVDLIGLPELKTADVMAPVRQAIADRILSQPLNDWLSVFEGHDVCVSEIKPLSSTLENPHFAERGVFNRTTTNSQGQTVTALPVPIDATFRDEVMDLTTPALGEHTAALLK